MDLNIEQINSQSDLRIMPRVISTAIMIIIPALRRITRETVLPNAATDAINKQKIINSIKYFIMDTVKSRCLLRR